MSTQDTLIEPLLDPQNVRDSLRPIRYQNMWDMYQLHLSSFWTAQEIDLSKDLSDWNTKLTPDEQKYIKYGLAFFAASDLIVNELQTKDREEVVVLEYKFFNDDKMARENIHSQSYSDLIHAYVTDEKERLHLLNAVHTIPSIKKKADWVRKYINNGKFVERMLAGAITEGIFFSGTFCAIFWLKKRGLMPGLCDSNELISKDEGLHRDFNCMVYRDHIVNKLTNENVILMIKEAVEIETEFCVESLPVSLIGMNSESMIQYIKFVADHLCFNLIGSTIFSVENPFSDWMTAISLNIKTDFFVHRLTNYAKQSVFATDTQNTIRFDEDF